MFSYRLTCIEGVLQTSYCFISNCRPPTVARPVPRMTNVTWVEFCRHKELFVLPTVALPTRLRFRARIPRNGCSPGEPPESPPTPVCGLWRIRLRRSISTSICSFETRMGDHDLNSAGTRPSLIAKESCRHVGSFSSPEVGIPHDNRAHHCPQKMASILSDATKRAWRRLKKLAGIKMILPAGKSCHFPARVKS